MKGYRDGLAAGLTIAAAFIRRTARDGYAPTSAQPLPVHHSDEHIKLALDSIATELEVYAGDPKTIDEFVHVHDAAAMIRDGFACLHCGVVDSGPYEPIDSTEHGQRFVHAACREAYEKKRAKVLPFVRQNGVDHQANARREIAGTVSPKCEHQRTAVIHTVDRGKRVTRRQCVDCGAITWRG